MLHRLYPICQSNDMLRREPSGSFLDLTKELNVRNKQRTVLEVLSLAAATSVLLAACSSAPGDDDSAQSSETLVVANYGGVTGDVMKEHLEDPYSAETGVRFSQVAVSSGFTARLQAQADSGNIQWDVIEGLSSIDALVLAEEGVLAELPDDVKQYAMEGAVEGSVVDYGVSLGDTGIVVVANRDALDKVPTSVDDFFDVENFPGKRALMDNPVQIMGMALLADGVAPEDLFPMDIDRAIAKLEELKPFVDVWTTSGDQQMQTIRSGEADMAIMWNGRAMGLMNEGMNLEVSWDGSLVNPNYMVVVKGGPNEAAGMEFLKWYSQSVQGQAGIARDLAYGTSLLAVADELTAAQQQFLPAANLDRQARIDPQWYIDNTDEIQAKWRAFLGS